jgi:hypothetical protein
VSREPQHTLEHSQSAPAQATHGELPIVIVSGLPRSGTSMMMQILRAGGLPVLTDEVRKADEDNRHGYLEFEAVKRTKTDPSWLSQASGKAVKMVYRLLYDLPADRRYHVVFMRRNMEEVLASQRAMLVRQGKDAANADAAMRHLFQRDLEKVAKWLSERTNFSTLYVDYTKLVLDPRAHLDRINEFLDNRLDVAAMASAVDVTQYRNRSDEGARTVLREGTRVGG